MSAPETALSTQFDSSEFRKAMGTFCTGVTVVTIPQGEGVVGMTANSFTSVSLTPPLVLISVGKNLSMHGWIREAGKFGVTVLTADQVEASNYFAGKRTPEVEATLRYDWHETIPMLSGGLANVACRLWAEYDGGDHTLFLGKVVGLRVHDKANPLLYYGGYRKLE
ncbi:NADH-dependent flavin reductase [compost metagenome]